MPIFDPPCPQKKAIAASVLHCVIVKELNYSGSAAMRRLKAARLLKEVPAVTQKIQDGSLNLSQIGERSRAIKENEKTTGLKISVVQKNDLVSVICGKTTQETQMELSTALDIEFKKQETQRTQKDESNRLEITLSKSQFQKLSRCKDLTAYLLEQGHKDSSWASIIEVLSDQYLNKKELNSSTRPISKTATQGKSAFETKSGNETESVAASETESVIKVSHLKCVEKLWIGISAASSEIPLLGESVGELSI